MSAEAADHQPSQHDRGALTLRDGLLLLLVPPLGLTCFAQLRTTAHGPGTEAISSLRTLVSSQAIFYQGDMDHDNVYDYATSLEELSLAGLIDNVLETGTKGSYRFELYTIRPDSCWSVSARCLEEQYEFPFFYVDEYGVIRFHPSRPAGPADAPLDRERSFWFPH